MLIEKVVSSVIIYYHMNIDIIIPIVIIIIIIIIDINIITVYRKIFFLILYISQIIPNNLVNDLWFSIAWLEQLMTIGYTACVIDSHMTPALFRSSGQRI